MAKLYFGPYHPAYKEPIGLVLEIEEEKVVDVEISIGYAHRNIEKILENTNWVSGMVIASKICGICSSVHNNTYCQGVERIFGIDIPERAKFIRMFVLEMERIQSHLLWFGTLMHEIGYEYLFMSAWEARERVLEIMEKISGRRVGWMVSIPGGVRRDLKKAFYGEILKTLEYVGERVRKFKEEVTKNETILLRLKNVGKLSRREVEKYCLVGPVARASGVKRDVRYDDPYLLYEDSPYKIIVKEEGDCLARTLIRLEEVENSIEIIKWVLDNIKEGDLAKKIGPYEKPPEGEAMSRMEAPRGELFYYIRSTGDLHPKRVRIRTPTFANIPALAFMLKGAYLADVPAIVFSFDPCISCMDRVIVKSDRDTRIMTRKELLDYAKKWFEENYDELREERL